MPNMTIVVITFIIGFLVLRHSGKSQERKSRAKIARMDPQPQHYWIDNQPTTGAWAWVVLITAIGTIIAFGGIH